jgi:hypothetical protein
MSTSSIIIIYFNNFGSFYEADEMIDAMNYKSRSIRRDALRGCVYIKIE